MMYCATYHDCFIIPHKKWLTVTLVSYLMVEFLEPSDDIALETILGNWNKEVLGTPNMVQGNIKSQYFLMGYYKAVRN